MRLGAEGQRISRFMVVGVLNTAVDFASFAVLHGLIGVALVPANLMAFALAVTNSWLWNRFWTFRAPTRAGGLRGIGVFVLANLGGAGAGTGALWLMVEAGLPVWLAKLLSTGASMAWNYLAMRLVVFRPDHFKDRP